MKTFLNIIFASLPVIIISFCSCTPDINDTDEPPVSAEDRIRSQTLQMIDGNIKEVINQYYRDPQVWLVIVETVDLAIVHFEFLSASRALNLIVGVSKPYNYNIKPGLNLLSFADAKEIALIARNGEITWWVLRKDKIGIDWEYRFFIMDDERLWDVRLKADTGIVTRNN